METMETIERLDTDINDLHARIATLRAHHANLSSILLSQPHLAARLQRVNLRDKSVENAQRIIKQQSKRNIENIYRACVGVTAYKVQDPDPHAINNGNILGVAIDVSIGSKFIETYHVLLNVKESEGKKLLRIHKHTIPPCIPLQQLASKWLPTTNTSSKDIDNAADPEQDLVRFGRSLRKELVAWHMRVQAVEDLRKEAGLPDTRRERNEQDQVGIESTGRILNAFVSDDDEESSDVDEAGDEDDGIVRILEIEPDAAVRQISITWSDGRTAVMNITKDGRVEKAVCRTRGGGRDEARSRKAIGPLGGLGMPRPSTVSLIKSNRVMSGALATGFGRLYGASHVDPMSIPCQCNELARTSVNLDEFSANAILWFKEWSDKYGRVFSLKIGAGCLPGHGACKTAPIDMVSVRLTLWQINPAVEQGTYLPIEQFPILKYIPERWAPSKQRAKVCYTEVTKIWNEARSRVATRRSNDDERESLCDRLLSGSVKCDIPLNDDQISNFLGSAHQGAADTTMSAILTNILFLAKYPWVQEKARAELDRVCGVERMPVWEDFKDLPYINCIIKEGLRLRPVVAVGVPHRVSRDDWYDGMLIPKDAAIFIPGYALHFTHYDEPEMYNPDRYLNHPRLAMDYAGSPDYENRDHYAYGAGRRICVGIHLAERTQWRTMARILWAFNIEPKMDSNTGKPADLDVTAYADGFIRCPLPFQVNFVPRSEQHVKVVETDFRNIKEFLKTWE
ncbi:hypothetical protein N0V83_002586 [Neocucurbitaria cava]|uniref:Cytochrome P450 n=1 Tax=Neocucurbitaria cava TaxID=798079 RepID=A0A9W9CPM7_9PLEO|nr:hypothetical protein N0V83_002586 [Neocucurbitaria cava]